MAAVSKSSETLEKPRWGFIDKKGKIAVEANLSVVSCFSEEMALVAPAPMTAHNARRLQGPPWPHLRSSLRKRRYDMSRVPDNGWWTYDWEWHRMTARFYGPFGFIDKTGKIVIPVKLARARPFSEGLAFASGAKYGFIDKSGRWAITADSKQFTGDFHEGLARFCHSRNERLEGFIDKKGNVAIPARFQGLGDFSEARAPFKTKNNRYGFIDKTGTVAIRARYEKVGPFKDGLATVLQDSRWGYINREGLVVIPPKYEQALEFSCGLAAVKVAEKWGYIDKTGKTAIAPQFAGASVFRDGRARVNIGGTQYTYRPDGRSDWGDDEHYWVLTGGWRYINKSGAYICDLEFDNALDFRDGLAAVEVFTKYGLKDSCGRIVLPAKYDNFDSKFIEGMAKVVSRGRWGFMDDSGRLAIRPVFKQVCDFSEGSAAVKIGAKWGFIDKKGGVLLKPRWILARGFSDGLAAVLCSPASGKTKGQWGYVDKSGKVAISAQYCSVQDFSEGVAAACKITFDGNGGAFWGLIDKKGGWLIPPVFSNSPSMDNGLYSFQIDENRRILVDRKGRVHLGKGVTRTVEEHLTPILLELLESQDARQQRTALLSISVFGAPQLSRVLRKAVAVPDPYTSLLAARMLEQVTGANASDIILQRLHDRNSGMADRAAEAAMLLVSDPVRAAAFLGNTSRAPVAYRKKLVQRAAMAVLVGPRTPRSWKHQFEPLFLKEWEFSEFITVLNYKTDSPVFADWIGLGNLPIAPDMTIRLDFPCATRNRTWDEVLASLLAPSIDCIFIDGITVVSTREQLRAIVKDISDRPSIGSKQPAANNAVSKLLQARISFTVNTGMLQDGIEEWRETSGVELDVDWEAIAQQDIKPHMRAQVDTRNTTVETALKLLFISAGGPGKLAYRVHGGKLCVTTSPAIPEAKTPTPDTILRRALTHSDKEVRAAAARALRETQK